MSESFADLFEESLQQLDMAPGAIVTGTVVAIDGDFVTVHAGLKSEGFIPRSQFFDDQGKLSVAIGDEVKVALESVEDGFGATQLSREKAKRAEAWQELEQAYEKDQVVEGQITGRVRGGFTVNVNSINAFLPGSLVDIRPLHDTSHLEQQTLEFKLVKLDSRRNNIVVSRRAVLEAAYSEERAKLLANLEEGVVVKGLVKNLTDYGAFIDLGGVDGLLHITDIAWKRVKHPSEVLAIGQEVDVKVLRFDKERNRVSLGLKQLSEDPWDTLIKNYHVGGRAKARVTNLTDYGCFAEIENGIEGLIHVSEMDWTNRNIHPSKVVQVGQEIEVMLLDIDQERRRISLGIKQCLPNPWEAFSSSYKQGDQITGMVKSITDFGVFIGLDHNIDGLIHMSDLSWEDSGEEAVKQYKKGDELTAVILSIDTERERVALGLKQLDQDPFAAYTAVNQKGAVVTGNITSVTDKTLQVALAEGVEGTLRIGEAAREHTDTLHSLFHEGEVLESKIINVDRRNRQILLSVKQLDMLREKQAMQQISQNAPEADGPTTIGDLIKEQLKKGES
ncbi:30S ribosomal protein S1 [Pontibacter sp. JAM-7]|uniref:30S ribosomal protein S1 n=1 Tax=Pontibacter sp. JAM-7 TaxID=3366581 RepID=UPI003AF8D191